MKIVLLYSAWAAKGRLSPAYRPEGPREVTFRSAIVVERVLDLLVLVLVDSEEKEEVED